MSFKLSPEYALLGVLMTGPKHGYEMHSYFSSKMGQFWRLSMSQVYSLLKRMEKNGVVVSKERRIQTKRGKSNVEMAREVSTCFPAYTGGEVHVEESYQVCGL